MKKIFLMIFTGLCFCLLAFGQTITVTSPAAGVTWYRGSPYTITWTKSGAMPDTIKIRLRRWGAPESEAAVANIADSTANDESSDPWTIPNTVPAGDYFVRVRTTTDPDVIGNSGKFHISGAKFVSRIPPERMPPLLQKFPRLEVSNIGLSPNTDGFGIVFSYKNVGEGALPKASEVPVKPSYRVLIDGREVAKGFLFIPAFAAQPGWEQTGYFGGWIKLPSLALLARNSPGANIYVPLAEIYNWYIGDQVTVHINENKVMGMESHTLGKNLRLMVKSQGNMYDLQINNVSYDWTTHHIKIVIVLDGKIPNNKNFDLVCTNNEFLPDGRFFSRQAMDKRIYNFSIKVNIPPSDKYKVFPVFIVPNAEHPEQNIGDFNWRSNWHTLSITKRLH